MNKVYLIGNLTRDPEIRTTTTGIQVCNFSIAVNRRRRADGVQETDFFNIVTWRQLAELCSKYLSKGRKVAVSGSIQTRTYEAQDGSKHLISLPTKSSSFPLRMHLHPRASIIQLLPLHLLPPLPWPSRSIIRLRILSSIR